MFASYPARKVNYKPTKTIQNSQVGASLISTDYNDCNYSISMGH